MADFEAELTAKFEAQNLHDAQGFRDGGQNELLSELRNMVNNRDSGDVTLNCNDGHSIHASRWLLANRCPVFKSMLCNGMLETTSSEIQLVNFPSRVMLAIVEYLYTGTIESYPPVEWKMAFEMITAAQFFMIPRIKALAQDFLRSQAACGWEKSDLMVMLSVALEFPEEWEGKNAVLLRLVDGIGHDWSDEHCSHRLSRSAVEYILANCQPGSDQGEDQGSFEEYFTLRKIVLWHAYQVLPVGDVEARATVRTALPGKFPLDDWREMLEIPVDVDGYIADLSNSTDPRNSAGALNALLNTDVCEKSLQQMLSRINLPCIPALLLLKVIHPLQIFEHGQVFKALVQRALHSHVQYSLSTSDWKHGPSLKTGSEGRIMCSHATGEGKGAAIAFIPTARSKVVYEWSFEILENDTLFIEVGFIRLPGGQVVERDDLLMESLSDMTCTGMLCIDGDEHCTTRMTNDPNSSLDAWESRHRFDTQLGRNSVVTFKLNEVEKTCKARFSNTFETVWEGLQDGDYYPAVGFHSCRNASVRLKLISGFDFDSAGRETVDASESSISREGVQRDGQEETGLETAEREPSISREGVQRDGQGETGLVMAERDTRPEAGQTSEQSVNYPASVPVDQLSQGLFAMGWNEGYRNNRGGLNSRTWNRVQRP